MLKFVQDRQPSFYKKHKYDKVTEKQLLNAVMKEELFGFLEVDVHVPDELFHIFEEMSPIFCNADVGFKDIGPYMQQYICERNMSTNPRKLLVGAMSAKKILLSSPLLRWYLQHGLIVTKIYQVIEFTPLRCFRNFVNQVSDARRAGDVAPEQGIIADTMKLIGNSGYGSLIMDKEKHQDIKYIQGQGKTQLKMNDPLFRKCNNIGQDLFEIELAKRKIKMDLPIQLGYHILQLAKLRMLQFKYDFLDVYCLPNSYEYLEMDTDSAYLAISGKSLDDILKPDKRDLLHQQKLLNCHDYPFTAVEGFFPRECCNKHKAYDKRTPGLFKVEAEGTAMIALCSKTYILKQKDDKVKFSSKGINKDQLANPFDMYKEVLKSKSPHGATNRGFRPRHGTMYTYSQFRDGISYFYCKREVLLDGVHTKPLQIIASPWPTKEYEIIDEHHPWSLTTIHHFNVEGEHLSTLSDVCVKAITKTDPRAYVKASLNQLPVYTPRYKLRVAITKSMLDTDFSFWRNESFWTTGMSVKASPLRENTPGQNVLGQLLGEMK